MLRSTASILTAAIVAALICESVPGDEPRRADPAKAKAAAPPIGNSRLRSDRAMSPSEAAGHAGENVTVELTVQSTGSNGPSFEFYSNRTWMEAGSLFVRFPEETQRKFEKLGVTDLSQHFAGKTVRVTGLVQPVKIGTYGVHPLIVVRDIDQIELIHKIARMIDQPTPFVPAGPSSDETGFRSLFNGHDLTGWKIDGNDGGGWRVENGEIVALGEGFQNWEFLVSDHDYQNVVLRFEFKVGQDADSGVGIRIVHGERVGDHPRNLEVQIHDDEGLPAGQGAPTGSLFWSNGGPMMRPQKMPQLRPRGEWNTMEVEVQGRHIRAAVNGAYVIRADLQPLIKNPHVLPGAYRDQGRVGLQRHTGEVRFRNIRIKELAPQPAVALDAGGHTSSVKGAVFTTDGKQLVTVSHDKTIRVWDVNTGAPARVLRPPLGSGKIGEYFAVALSPDGTTVAAGGHYGRVFLIDLASGRMRHFLVGHSDSVNGLDFSPDGRSLATASSDKTVRIWDVATGKTIRTLAGHTAVVNAVRFSPDGRKLATGARDKSARIFLAIDGSLDIAVTAERNVTDVDWSADGQTLITSDSTGNDANAKGAICLWGPDGSVRNKFTAPGGVSAMRSGKVGAVVYTWSKYPKKGAVILDLENGQPRSTFDRSWNDLNCAALSPDGQLAATGGFDAADLRIWRTADGQQLHQLRAQGGVKWSAGWGADGTTIAWGNAPYRDRPTHLNDMGPRNHSFDLKTLQSVEPTVDSQRGSLILDDLVIEKGGPALLLIKRAGEVVRKIDTNPLGGEWRAAAWVDRDRVIVGTNIGQVALVDANTGKLKHYFVGHVGTIWAIAPSPDRRYVLTASQDSTLRVWSVDRQSPILTLYFSDDGEWIAWSGKGYYAASTSGERLMGWHVSNGLNAMASFYPAAQFRKTLYRPDVIKRLLDSGAIEKALADADAAAGKSTTDTELARILPPNISITKPLASPAQLSEKTLEVEAVARSVGPNPITALRVLIDGRPAPDGLTTFQSPVNGEARGTWSVDVPPGTHRLTVEASTAASKGISEPIDVVAGEIDGVATGRLYVLVVGINKYLHLGDRAKLDSAVADAQSIQKAFQDFSRPLFRSVESRILIDRQATRANILEALQWLKQSVATGDKAVIFYAGHGDNQITGQFYILPVDARIDNLGDTGISDDDLQKAIGELPCSTVLMLDACYSGSFGRKKRKTRSLAKPTDALAGSMVNDYGLAILCGARDNQEAIEEGGHGFFTQALTQGLAGAADADKDGLVELYELLPFVKSRVSKLSAGDQVPTVGIPPSVESFPLSKP
jgi:WD40 repeat protein